VIESTIGAMAVARSGWTCARRQAHRWKRRRASGAWVRDRDDERATEAAIRVYAA